MKAWLHEADVMSFGSEKKGTGLAGNLLVESS